MSAWFEDEAFWREGYPFMFSESAFSAAQGEVEQIHALPGCAGGSVFDFGCGPGRRALPLAARGFKITSVDRLPTTVIR